MDMDTLLSYQWSAMMPEFIILGVATLISLLDLFVGKRIKHSWLGYLAAAGVIGSFVSLCLLRKGLPVTILYDTFRLDSFAVIFKFLLLIGAFFTLLIAIHERSDEIKHRGEFYYLFLTALLGAMMMASSGDLITLFVGLELLSISSYILAGIKKSSLRSNEAALKYVITGGIASAIALFGLSYIYGITGSTNLLTISEVLGENQSYEFIAVLAFLLVLVGLTFKIASAPFHMWAPDVYEGSPTSVTAFLSVVSKTAGFVLILRVFLSVFANVPMLQKSVTFLYGMQDYLFIVAGVTIVIGNVVALRQKNMKRLFAYSSIAHAGYVLVAFAVLSPFMMDAIWFYLLAYLFMTVGAFTVIHIIQQQQGNDGIISFAGLYKTSPYLAIVMSGFLLSLAGIPGTAGFIGKFNIFLGALATSPTHYIIVSLMIIATVISYYYYFGIFTQMFFRSAEQERTYRVPRVLLFSTFLCLGATIILGIFPNVAYQFFFNEVHQFKDFFN
ncbi:NADH-quinone oxidoreductase subunit NuoN [Priestia koreensis]|uniref:NADH-quinone oxidoreductase subunit NuoN n=1 Tax=Priestia koreensis TaxID=284581 RepID=UPI00345A61D7